MKLKVKDVDISAGDVFIAILNEEDAKKLNLYASDRIKIKKSNRQIIAAIDIASNKNIKPGEIGLFEEVLKKLKLKNKDLVQIFPVKKPESIQYIKKKLDKKELSKKEIDQIIKDIVENKLTEIERTSFISACYINKLNTNETAYLTEAIAQHGGKLNIRKKIVCDKHCVGGVPGNRTTMIIVPILAAAGLTIPKTSSRAITSASGTVDTMEVLAPVSFTINKIEKIIKKTNGCIIWGGAVELASADDKLIEVERPLSLDPMGIMLASILAKKLAVGATHILIDIPYGKTAKVKTKNKALNFKKEFLKLGRRLKLKTKVVLTDGKQPIGNGIGPSLEAKDVLKVLLSNGPEDLKNKSLYLASIILKMAGIKNSKEKAKQILESGLAYKKMKEIIKAQGGKIFTPDKIPTGKFTYKVKAKKAFTVKHINNKALARIARVAGAPKDKEAGIYLNFKINNKVKKNNTLFTIYSKDKKKLQDSLIILNKQKIIY